MATDGPIVFYDERVLSHQPVTDDPLLTGRLDRRIRDILASLPEKWVYPEHPGRLTAIDELLREQPIPGLRFKKGSIASRKQLARVHTTAYLDRLERLRGRNAWLDVDTTAISAGSIEAAEIAAGTAVAAVEAVMAGKASSAFALVRPPGHHAEANRARGFCLYNNVAVAAAHARAALGCERVLIIDWDAHHGNGTQDIFWADPDVLFFDTHGAPPFYPGTGELDEIGGGLGEGTTVNVPLPMGTGDTVMLDAFRRILVPAADWFRPDLVLVSAGFDPHRLDQAFNMTDAGFGALTDLVRDIARRHCDGRLAFVLEGGYTLESLASGVHAVLSVLAGGAVVEPEDCGAAAVAEAEAFHRAAFVD